MTTPRTTQLPDSGRWSTALHDTLGRQILGALASACVGFALLALAARRGVPATPNDALSSIAGVGLVITALALAWRARFTLAHRPFELTADAEGVRFPHMGWRTRLVSLRWDEVTGVGVRKAAGAPAHALAIVTRDRTFMLPKEMLGRGHDVIEVAGVLEHLRLNGA